MNLSKFDFAGPASKRLWQSKIKKVKEDAAICFTFDVGFTTLSVVLCSQDLGPGLLLGWEGRVGR
jgi:hypothetical protein